MIRKTLLSGVAALSLAGQARAVPAAVSPPYSPPAPKPNYTVMRAIGVNNVFMDEGLAAPNTVYSATSREAFTSTGPITVIGTLNRNGQITSGQEAAGNATVLERQSIEYGNAVQSFSTKGQATWLNDRFSAFVETDLLGVNIPAATSFNIRKWTRVPAPPTGVAVAAAAGGALVSGTTYYYTLVTLDNNQPATKTTEVSFTPFSANLSGSLTWTKPANGDTIQIFRSTTSGAETFLASVPATATGYTDTGYIAATLGATPGTQNPTFLYNHKLGPNETTNDPGNGGTGLDLTGSTGALTGGGYNAGVSYNSASGPSVLFGNDLTSSPICGMGDSIVQGVGIQQNAAVTNSLGQANGNWFSKSLIATGRPGINLGIGGSIMAGVSSGSATNRFRLRANQLCVYTLLQLGINDLIGGATWQQLALSRIAFATALYNQGQRVVQTTLLPKTTFTDGDLTISGQTVSGIETPRANFNTWVRNGAQMSAGTPVLTGGSPSPYIYGFYDLAAPIEVNSAGTLTANGGFWPAGVSYLTGTLSGTSTTTSLTTTGMPLFRLAGMTLKMTSGAANGQTAIIANDSATTNIALYAYGATPYPGIGTVAIGLTTAPASGDTFTIYDTPTVDGAHPNISANATIATDFTAKIPTLMPNYAGLGQ